MGVKNENETLTNRKFKIPGTEGYTFYHIMLSEISLADSSENFKNENRKVGDKMYELSNHLGNVLEVITDRKIPVDAGGGVASHYTADVVSYCDYGHFGVIMEGRNGSTNSYRYSFQGQEDDPEIKGQGNSVNYKYRMHDPRIGRFFAVDPLAPEYPHNSPYAFSENRVIDGVELEGLEYTRTNTIHYYQIIDGEPILQKTSCEEIEINWWSYTFLGDGYARSMVVDENGKELYFFDESHGMTSYEKLINDINTTDEERAERKERVDFGISVIMLIATDGMSGLTTSKTSTSDAIQGKPIAPIEIKYKSKQMIGSINRMKTGGAKTQSLATRIFRGGDSFKARIKIDYKLDADGYVIPGKGVSINTNKWDKNVQKWGGAFEVDLYSIPEGLTIIRTKGTHYEIVPTTSMTEAEFVSKVGQIKVKYVNSAGN